MCRRGLGGFVLESVPELNPHLPQPSLNPTMHEFPRADFGPLLRYTPDQSPIAVDIADNRNLWGSHPAALAVLQRSDPSQVAPYPDPYGSPLRRAVAERFQVPESSVATGPGGTAVLDRVFRIVSGSAVRLSALGWPAVGMLARMNAQELVQVSPDAALDDPSILVGTEPSIVYVANPNNPIGDVASDAWLKEVQRLSESIGSVLVLDEAYGEYYRDPLDAFPQTLALGGQRTILVKTMSKAYGLAGLRAGYAIARPEVVLEIDKARGPFMLSQLAGQAAAAAITDKGTWLEAVVANTVESRTRLLECLRHRGFSPPESHANFVFVPLDSEIVETVHRDLVRMGVRPRPFNLPSPGGAGLRCTVGPWDQMQRLLDALDHLGVNP